MNFCLRKLYCGSSVWFWTESKFNSDAAGILLRLSAHARVTQCSIGNIFRMNGGMGMRASDLVYVFDVHVNLNGVRRMAMADFSYFFTLFLSPPRSLQLGWNDWFCKRFFYLLIRSTKRFRNIFLFCHLFDRLYPFHDCFYSSYIFFYYFELESMLSFFIAWYDTVVWKKEWDKV